MSDRLPSDPQEPPIVFAPPFTQDVQGRIFDANGQWVPPTPPFMAQVNAWLAAGNTFLWRADPQSMTRFPAARGT